MDLAQLEALGLTKEDVLDRLVKTILGDFQDPGEFEPNVTFRDQVEKTVMAAVIAKIQALFDEHVRPKVGEMIEEISLQRTNEWGEKQGKPKRYAYSRQDLLGEARGQP